MLSELNGEWVVGGCGWRGQPPPAAMSVPGVSAVWCSAAVPVRAVSVLGAGELVLLGACPAGEEELRAALVAAGRGRWAALTALPGSYWCVAELDSGGRQFVCGDLAGLRGVFRTSTEGPDAMVWASRAGMLAGRTGSGVDWHQVAAELVSGAGHWPTATSYEGVAAVAGGSGLVWHPRDGRVSGTVNTRPRCGELPLEDGAEAFGEALGGAVAWRAEASGGDLGADLSGGLDSSTAVLLAAERARGLVAVTYGGPLASAEDTATARRVADHAGVRHHVATEPTWHFQTLPATATEAPVLASSTAALDAAYLAPAAGRRMHLTGHGGDVVLDASSAVWPDLIARGQRRAAHRGLAATARRRNTAPGPLWRHAREQAALTRPQALNVAADQVAAGTAASASASTGWSWVHLGAAAAWLTPAGREAVAGRLRQAADVASAAGLPGAFDDWAALHATAAECRAHHPLYTALGANLTHPFLDNTVVRAAFDIPAHRRHVPGRPKVLLGAALPGLPRWLTSRSSKGSFAPMLLTGLRRERARLHQLIVSHPLVGAGLIDPHRARATLDAVADGREGRGAGGGLAAVHHLLVIGQWATVRPAEVA
ncbi:asparagine synthase-related protein [Streptomyces johnsoniae]|uniref:Asparagine synthase-related protein n=1 Tax=Streptomyces johnsoniae TaxID=3075532 RepID=A0ABU2SCU2_9ACTN|nr:asparagine synthase-related protein [Streptomyces sp. DSM 41886]MDT0446796.1 asparagine synthase-related protein [Streptomyces sp. DSM 41886]